jgi:hypothetical protein
MAARQRHAPGAEEEASLAAGGLALMALLQ